MFLTAMDATKTVRLEQTLIAVMFPVPLIMSAIPQIIGGATADGGLIAVTATPVSVEWKITTAGSSVQITAAIKKTENGVKEAHGKAEHIHNTAPAAAMKTAAARYARTMSAIQETKNGATAENGLWWITAAVAARMTLHAMRTATAELATKQTKNGATIEYGTKTITARIAGKRTAAAFLNALMMYVI